MAGGGVGRDTVISCKGVALKKAFEPKAKSASGTAAKAKPKPKASSQPRVMHRVVIVVAHLTMCHLVASSAREMSGRGALDKIVSEPEDGFR